jgi:hypothetical protein
MRRIKPVWLLILIGVLFSAVLVARAALFSPTQLTTQPGTGIVTGQLDLSSLDGMPYNAQDLYLATFVYSNQSDVPPVISFTYGVDPQTTVHEPDGKFAFTNVPPNTYALIIWTPVGGFVIEPPEGGFIQVVVEEGKTTDLGTVLLR